MSNEGRRFVGSKWLKTKAALRDEAIRRYVPKTVRMTESSLRRMLDRYRMVYVKPVNGSFGIGVIRVEKRSGSAKPYWYQSGKTPHAFADFASMWHSLNRRRKPGSYLVQQGIHLLNCRGRRFDLRVMVQKSPQGEWESTGIIGRLAQRGKVVTNYHNGGQPLGIGTLFASHLSGERLRSYESTLKRVGLQSAQALTRRFPGLKAVGADIGVDHTLHPWILELNTNPDPYIFKHHPDRDVYRKVLRYYRASRGTR